MKGVHRYVIRKMVQLGTNRSVIRDLFEYGNKRKAEIGAENVFDFSIGNPSVPAPECVKEAAIDLLTNGDPVALHGYTSAQGDAALREKLASYVNEQHSTNLTADNFYVTVGAAASLTISLKHWQNRTMSLSPLLHFSRNTVYLLK